MYLFVERGIADDQGSFACINAWAVECGFQGVAVVGKEREKLRHGRKNVPAAGRAQCKAPLSVLGDNGAVVGQATLAWRKRIGAARFRVESHDAVIHQHARLG
jgi:hypothetical protein